MQNEQANPYYVPTASTQSHGGTSGGSVNLGAIAGAAGIGGSLGSLASGVNVGGSSTNVNTKTTFSQRIVSVPPLSILELDPMDIGFGRIVLGWGKWDYKNVYHDLYIPYFIITIITIIICILIEMKFAFFFYSIIFKKIYSE